MAVSRVIRVSGAAIFVSLCSGLASAQPAVVSTTPARNATNVARSAPIVVRFDRPMNPSTFTNSSFRCFGKLLGPRAGTIAFSESNTVMTFTPTRALLAGETCLVTLSHDLRAADGTFLRAAGYSFSYSARVRPTAGSFTLLTSFSNRNAEGDQTRIYGGVACDLNRDGWADLTMVNEVSSDLTVFLNRADGSGLYQPMIEPPTPIPVESSPNEPADFDNDGFIDLVVSSGVESSIAVCFGAGNGTFNSVLEIPVGDLPRGFGILDADGDGDPDITVACASSNNIAYVRNNGNRTFATPTFFQGNVSGEYGMTAADMNNDGIMDLVVAGSSSQTVSVVRGNGNGTFTVVSTRSVGGQNWVIQCGDVNNDGNMDVSAANSFSANGSILLGNGNGTLQAAMVTPTDGHTVSTDLADIDGDGDLDWVLSSFGANRWYVYKNNGAGVMTQDVQFPAPANPSCAICLDFDNDGDVDLALTDEIADVVVLMDNTGNECASNYNGDSEVNSNDVTAFLDQWFADQAAGTLLADFDLNGETNSNDISAFLNTWFIEIASGNC